MGAETRPFSYSYVKARNVVDKWDRHVISWMHYRSKGVVFVRFSDLKNHLEETLRSIESRTTQRLKPEIRAVLLEDQRYRPDYREPGIPRGEVGIWKKYFNKEDLALVDQGLSEQTRQFLDSSE